MLRHSGGCWIAGASVLVLGLAMGCKPAPEPLTWRTVTGPEGLFEAEVPASWGELTPEGGADIIAFATKAAEGAYADPLVLQRRAMQEQPGLLITFQRIWRSAVSDEAWINYISERIELEAITHNSLTDRSVVEHVREGHRVTLVVHHQSFGSRAYYELIRLDERQGILLTARMFVPRAVFLAHADDLRAHLGALEWSEVQADVELPDARLPSVDVPAI